MNGVDRDGWPERTFFITASTSRDAGTTDIYRDQIVSVESTANYCISPDDFLPMLFNPYRNLTVIGLIVACALVFGAERMQHSSWAENYGANPISIVPAFQEIIHGHWSISAAKALSRLVSALFLHADVEHIGFNMVFLWAFGYLTSQVLGQWRMLIVYFICGVCGNILQVWFNADLDVSIIGASGAICGLEGVYLGLAVQWRLPFAEVWPLAYPVPPMQIGAFAIIGFVGDMVLLANHDQRIAYGAHLGGLLSGVVIAAVVTSIYPTMDAYQRAAK